MKKVNQKTKKEQEMKKVNQKTKKEQERKEKEKEMKLDKEIESWEKEGIHRYITVRIDRKNLSFDLICLLGKIVRETSNTYQFCEDEMTIVWGDMTEEEQTLYMNRLRHIKDIYARYDSYYKNGCPLPESVD